jgi:UDP-N-acetylmuramoyl-tripeptide--D-alanyl-D-alanine ligase
MRLALAEIAEIVGAEPPRLSDGAGEEPALVTGFATDHRDVEPGDLFLAIKGAKVDGHDFAEAAVHAGAVAVLAEREVPVPHLLVPNLVEAIAQLGSHFRALFDGPVIGITGSAGKTSTKEFVSAALSPRFEVIKSEGNKNTEYTSPLIWPQTSAPQSDMPLAAVGRRKAAVVEMAMRGKGQIAHLAKIHRPNIAIITNIGYAHLEQVGSRQGIADAKAELIEALPEDGIAILPRDDDFFDFLKTRTKANILTFGTSPDSDCRIEHYRALNWSEGWIKGTCKGKPFEATIPSVGSHQAQNAAAAILAAAALGVDPTEAGAAIKQAQLPPMRMQVLNLNAAMVLLDTYNASPPAMVAAIETLAELPAMGRKIAVLGEMKELGDFTIEAHREIGRALVKANLYKVLFYGMPMTFARQELIRAGAPGDRLPFATSLKDVEEFLRIEMQPGDAVLIKGSRALELEKVLDALKVGA